MRRGRGRKKMRKEKKSTYKPTRERTNEHNSTFICCVGIKRGFETFFLEDRHLVPLTEYRWNEFDLFLFKFQRSTTKVSELQGRKDDLFFCVLLFFRPNFGLPTQKNLGFPILGEKFANFLKSSKFSIRKSKSRFSWVLMNSNLDFGF
jgi:hypothetical protein